MRNLSNFYTARCEELNRELNRLNRKIHQTGTVKLFLVLAAIFFLYVNRQEPIWVLLTISLTGIVLYILLSLYHNKLFSQRNYTEKKLNLNLNEQKALLCDFQAYDGASELISPAHNFSLDLDVFGNHSLFQSVNRTVTDLGKAKLAEWFTNPETDRNNIEKRQKAVAELAGHPELFQHFYTIGSLKNKSAGPMQPITRFVQNIRIRTNNKLNRILTWIIPAGWILIVIGYQSEYISDRWLNLYVLFALICALFLARQVNKVYQKSERLNAALSVYTNLIRIIEQTELKSEWACENRNRLSGHGKKSSELLATLNKNISALEQRFSLAGLLFNLFYLRDIRHTMALEQWIQKHHDDIVVWLDALGEFDAMLSLGNYAFNHPDYHFPTIEEKYFKLTAKNLGHPLMKPGQCVRNDINLLHDTQFLIVTGANMAGKSTYLRTVGINFLLGCIGLPVCAESMTFYPARLVTSLRTSDSLNENESYFFAELKRLKMIIDRLKNGEQLFIILDEILKGTNSADKQKGSMALVRQLLNFHACGIIATHDLILGTLEKEFPESVHNFCFEADICNDELTFSYRLRKGIAQNMNACFLMRKMNITV